MASNVNPTRGGITLASVFDNGRVWSKTLFITGGSAWHSGRLGTEEAQGELDFSV